MVEFWIILSSAVLGKQFKLVAISFYWPTDCVYSERRRWWVVAWSVEGVVGGGWGCRVGDAGLGATLKTIVITETQNISISFSHKYPQFKYL